MDDERSGCSLRWLGTVLLVALVGWAVLIVGGIWLLGDTLG